MKKEKDGGMCRGLGRAGQSLTLGFGTKCKIDCHIKLGIPFDIK